jgi:hypothetical protein
MTIGPQLILNDVCPLRWFAHHSAIGIKCPIRVLGRLLERIGDRSGVVPSVCEDFFEFG